MINGETMIDTIGSSVGNIPSNATKVAGYTTGGNGIEWTQADWDRFAKTAGELRICQNPNGDPLAANAFDIEPGALSIPDFIRMATVRQNKSWNSCGYIEASQVGDLVQACEAAHLTMVQLWVANWNLNEGSADALLGTMVRNYQIVAVQWASPTSNPNTICPGTNKTLRELNLDLSQTIPAWFAKPLPAPPTPVPTPTPGPAPQTATLALVTPEGHDTLTIISHDDGKSWSLA